MKISVSMLIVFICMIILITMGIVVIINFNGIIISEKILEESKANIETACQRRLDLIPNLVEIVKGYSQHEQTTLVSVTLARNQAQELLNDITSKKSLNKEDIIALSTSQKAVKGALNSLFALAENYPSLKASSNYLSLQDQMEGTENRINVARQRYNSGVKDYHIRIETFPGNIVAAMFGFEQKSYFESESKADKGVEVSF